MLGIGELLPVMPARLSGGQAHRVALGRLLLARCDALLLDEPYTGLDAHLRRALTDLVVALVVARDVPAVLVAHELADAQAFADRLAILDRGQLLQIGAPDEVVLRPASRRAAELVGYLGFVPVADLPPGAAPVVAGIHPERAVAGAYPDRGVVLNGAVTACRPAGAGWEADVRVSDTVITCRLPDRPPGGAFAVTALDPPCFGPDGTAVPAPPAPAGTRLMSGPATPAAAPAPAGAAEPSGTRLRLARQARGFSQQQLAGMAGVSRQAVSAVEAGASDPSLRVALALARALGLTVEEMFGPRTPAPQVDAQPLAPLGDGGARVTLAAIGDHFVALPLAGAAVSKAGFVPADGLAGPPGPAGTPGAARPVRPLSPPRPTLVVAGCDPAIPLLEAPLGLLDPPVSFAWWQCASGAALELAARGLVHAAGAHLRSRSGEYNVGSARTVLRQGAEVIGFCAWREGLVLRPGHAVSGITDVIKAGLRLVNREPGSEARLLLDRELAAAGADPAQLPGYDSQATGHLHVASAVAAGLADVGVASEPAALAYGLAFIPLAAERFDLVIPAGQAGSREVAGLLKVLSSRWLLDQLASLPGYDPARCGEHIVTM